MVSLLDDGRRATTAGYAIGRVRGVSRCAGFRRFRSCCDRYDEVEESAELDSIQTPFEGSVHLACLPRVERRSRMGQV
jgi:hypothetical protein